MLSYSPIITAHAVILTRMYSGTDRHAVTGSIKARYDADSVLAYRMTLLHRTKRDYSAPSFGLGFAPVVSDGLTPLHHPAKRGSEARQGTSHTARYSTVT